MSLKKHCDGPQGAVIQHCTPTEVEAVRQFRQEQERLALATIARADRWLARQWGKHAISREEAGARIPPTWSQRRRCENA